MAGGRLQLIRRLLLPWLFISALLLLSTLASTVNTASAQARPPAASSHAIHTTAASTPAGHVTIIVLDMSSSMAQNDPSGVRCSASNGYIDLSGPGDYIGAVGLYNSSGARGGAHHFQLATVFAQPREMATASERDALKQAIAHQSNSCQPTGNTPTYDSLVQALNMLKSATHGGQTSGSVILLTDGAPYPDTGAQASSIDQELVPAFKKNQWPIDSIALGSDQSFHGFLSDISNATSGKFYDDGQGVVPGVSPLNIAPFFVDIFARQNGRVLGPTIAPVQLSGGATARDFQLPDYVDHLDVIVVKDTPTTTITLTTGSGQTLPPQVAGTFISTDPHYAIFSIDGPQKGTWTVNISGSGLALMDSLVVSSLSVNILAPAVSVSFLPLGQDFTVQAGIVYQNREITGGAYSVKGTLTYSGATTSGHPPFSLDLVLSDSGSPGTYSATVHMPSDIQAGAYTLTISVSQISATVIADAQRIIRFELFPAPLMLSLAGPTQDTVAAQAIQWDAGLQHIYGIQSGLVDWLSHWPLGGLPAMPSAVIHGVVELNGQPYADATVSG
ncbi:MAG: vWA domain-containing protein, partial [Ktedonobacterales bacterium]